MGKVVTAAAVSLDGFIAGPNGTGFEHLFAWFAGGDFEIPMADANVRIKLGEADHHFMREFWDRGGAFVSGRRLFDQSDGVGRPDPMGWPVVVVTHSVPQDWVAAHPGAPITFVTDKVALAIEQAKALAGEKDVVVRNVWVQHAFDATERPRPSKPRKRQWETETPAQELCIGSMAYCLPEIAAGRVPK
jgi:dihydrofolate reductase